MKLRRFVLCGGHRGLRAQVLQLFEADDLIGVEILAALQVALGLLGLLVHLLHLRADFSELDLRESLALLHGLTLLHVDAAHQPAPT